MVLICQCVCLLFKRAVCNQHGISALKYQSEMCVECVCTSYQGLFSLSHNQGVLEHTNMRLTLIGWCELLTGGI